MRKTMTMLGCVLMLGGCETTAEDRREALQEEIDERYSEQMDLKEEALEETAEGQAEHDAVLRGANPIQEEIDGFQAEQEVNERFEQAEEQRERGEYHPGMPMPAQTNP